MVIKIDGMNSFIQYRHEIEKPDSIWCFLQFFGVSYLFLRDAPYDDLDNESLGI